MKVNPENHGLSKVNHNRSEKKNILKYFGIYHTTLTEDQLTVQ